MTLRRSEAPCDSRSGDKTHVVREPDDGRMEHDG
jgi:hypothetical protein